MIDSTTLKAFPIEVEDILVDSLYPYRKGVISILEKKRVVEIRMNKNGNMLIVMQDDLGLSGKIINSKRITCGNINFKTF